MDSTERRPTSHPTHGTRRPMKPALQTPDAAAGCGAMRGNINRERFAQFPDRLPAAGPGETMGNRGGRRATLTLARTACARCRVLDSLVYRPDAQEPAPTT